MHITECSACSLTQPQRLEVEKWQEAWPGMQVIAEAIRLLLLAINTASTNGNKAAEQSLLAVLLMLLIKDIAPNLTATPALADIATKLVTHIASGPASAAFKAVVTGLPTQDKLKLQVCSAIREFYSPQ